MILEAALIHALAIPSAVDLKCQNTVPFPGAGSQSPIVVIDGQVFVDDTEFEASPIGTLDREDIYKVHVTCWNPATDEIHSRSGVRVIAVTSTEEIERTRADLESLLASVREFEANEARLPESLAELEMSTSAADRLTLESSGFGVQLSTSGLRDYHCSIAGDVSNDVEMQCELSLGLATAGLREAYDRRRGFSN